MNSSGTYHSANRIIDFLQIAQRTAIEVQVQLAEAKAQHIGLDLVESRSEGEQHLHNMTAVLEVALLPLATRRQRIASGVVAAQVVQLFTVLLDQFEGALFDGIEGAHSATGPAIVCVGVLGRAHGGHGQQHAGNGQE